MNDFQAILVAAATSFMWASVIAALKGIARAIDRNTEALKRAGEKEETS